MPAKSVSEKKTKSASSKSSPAPEPMRVSPPVRVKNLQPGQTRLNPDQVDIGALDLSSLLLREPDLETYVEEIPSQVVTFRWPRFQVERFDDFASRCGMNRGELIRTLLEAQMFKASLSISKITPVEGGAES